MELLRVPRKQERVVPGSCRRRDPPSSMVGDSDGLGCCISARGAVCVDSSSPLEAPTGIEPVASSIHGLEPNLAAWIERQAADAVRLYRPRFDVGGGL